VVGDIMCLDLSSIKPPKREVTIPKPQWRMVIDEVVSLKIIHWFAKNNEIVEPTCELIQIINNKGIVVK
jgi:hypothetical protein